MAATEYQLGTADWSDCGAADDCTLQLQSSGLVVFTTGAASPGAGSLVGTRLSDGPKGALHATIQKAGRKLWARALRGNATIVVER